MFFFVLELAALGAGGLYLYRDYRQGFPKTKALVVKIQRALHLGGEPDEVAIANAAIEKFAQGLGALREAVAEVETNHQMAVQQGLEQSKLAASFLEVEKDALRKQDENTAAVAAVAKINAKARAELFEEHAQESLKVAKVLHDELDAVEMEFEARRTEVDTVRVRAAIADARQKLYAVISQVEKETGLTAVGQLKQALVSSERRMLKTGFLLDMASNSGNGKIRKMMQLAEVRYDLDETRKLIALPAGTPENGDGECSVS